MPEKIIYIDGVGNVLLKCSNRARYLNISVKPFVGARVSVPVGVSYKSAAQFATGKRLEAHQQALVHWYNLKSVIYSPDIDLHKKEVLDSARDFWYSNS